MEQELEEVKIEKQLRKRRSESPEKESEHEVIKLSAPKMTKIHSEPDSKTAIPFAKAKGTRIKKRE